MQTSNLVYSVKSINTITGEKRKAELFRVMEDNKILFFVSDNEDLVIEALAASSQCLNLKAAALLM